MAKKGGLGTGLGALFGEELVPAAKTEKKTESTLPISRVEPRRDQPRACFDEDALAELTESIRQHGLIQPITVRKFDNGYYQIIAGERRWRAARTGRSWTAARFPTAGRANRARRLAIARRRAAESSATGVRAAIRRWRFTAASFSIRR